MAGLGGLRAWAWGAGTRATCPGAPKEQRVAETGTSIRALPESAHVPQVGLSHVDIPGCQGAQIPKHEAR